MLTYTDSANRTYAVIAFHGENGTLYTIYARDGKATVRCQNGKVSRVVVGFRSMPFDLISAEAWAEGDGKRPSPVPHGEYPASGFEFRRAARALRAARTSFLGYNPTGFDMDLIYTTGERRAFLIAPSGLAIERTYFK
jgi:hypothetical protein